MSFKILHIGKFYFPSLGGIETLTKDLSEGCTEKHQKVRVICSNTDKSFRYEKIAKVEVYKYPLWASIASQPISPKLLFSIKKHVEWADIIHIHSPNPLVELFSLFLPRGKLIINTHHSDIVKQKILKLFYKPIYNLFLRKVDRIFVPTENHIKYSDVISKLAYKTSIVPFGIDIKRKELDNDEHIKQLGTYILFVGRLVKYKGISYLIEAMKGLDCKLVIIGQGPLAKELKMLASKNKEIENKIIFRHDVSNHHELNSYYQNCYCFVLPSISKNENFGLVQLEAMSFAKPVITTKIKSGVPLVGIEGETTLLVNPKSSKDLAGSIKSLLDSPQKTQLMGKAAQKLYLEKYTVERMATFHLDAYQKALNEK